MRPPLPPEMPSGTVDPAEIEALIRASLQPSALHIQDNSAAHAGHASAAGGSHFAVEITSMLFEGKARLARHRLVYDALRSLLQPQRPLGIHALAIVARAPSESSS